MAEVKWIKITTSMFDDEKISLIQSMPEGDSLLVIWIRLLLQAGKINDNGFIYLSDNLPYTEEMLSTIFKRPANIIRLALATFEQFGMIELTAKGIYLPNWEKHQSADRLEAIREYRKIAKRKEREKKQLLLNNVNDIVNDMSTTSQTCQHTDIDIDIDIDNKKIYAQRFTEFWSIYPKKRSKGQAEKAFAKIRPDERLHNTILQSLELAKKTADWQKEKGKYIPYPATWLNAKGWEDEIEIPDEVVKQQDPLQDPQIRRYMELERERNAKLGG